MIQLIIPYTMTGVIWYQGETSVNRAYQYRTASPTSVRDWRKSWVLGDFPFHWCQLAKTPSNAIQKRS